MFITKPFLFERCFFWLVIAALSQNLSVPNAGKNVVSLVKRIHSVRGNTLLVFYLIVWVSCKWKNQQYIFNNSSILQMLGKDHVLFLKKILKFKILNFKISSLSVRSLYNSQCDPKIFRFLYNSNHQIV